MTKDDPDKSTARANGDDELNALREQLEEDPANREALDSFMERASELERHEEQEALLLWLGEHAGHETAVNVYDQLRELWSIHDDELSPRWGVVVKQLARRVEQATAERHPREKSLVMWLEDAVRERGHGKRLPPVLQKIRAVQAAAKAEERARSKHSTISYVLIAAGGIGLLFGILGVVFGLLGAKEAAAMKGWKKTPGKITRTWIEEHVTGSTKYHYPKIAYTYTVAGKKHTASRLDRSTYQRYTRRADAEKALQRFREQPHVTVHYDPANPDKAILNPKGIQGRTHNNLYGGGAALLLGLVLLPLGIIRLRHTPRKPA